MKFSIRDLLLVTVIVALTLAWWLDRRAWTRKLSDMEHENQIWQARAEELQLRSDMLVERLSVRPPLSPSAPSPIPPTTTP